MLWELLIWAGHDDQREGLVEFNSDRKSVQRRQLCQDLLGNESERTIVLEKISPETAGLLQDLLGYGQVPRIGDKMMATISSTARLLPKNGLVDEELYIITCRLLPRPVTWQSRVDKVAEAGDFEIVISEAGILKNVTLRKSTAYREITETGQLRHVIVGNVPNVDQVELLNPDDLPRCVEVAEIADLILLLQLKHGHDVAKLRLP